MERPDHGELHHVHRTAAQVRHSFLAPVKLLAALLLVVGLFLRPASIAGAILAIVISGFYLVRLAAPGRRDPAGLTGFIIFCALACALLALRLLP